MSPLAGANPTGHQWGEQKDNITNANAYCSILGAFNIYPRPHLFSMLRLVGSHHEQYS